MLTMDEYIKRESFMKRFCERCNEEMSESPCEPSDCFAREVIKTFPAADVAPVRHGRWVDNGIPDSILSRCSVCGFTCGSSSFFYCPICGAKMDEDDGNSVICSKTI